MMDHESYMAVAEELLSGSEPENLGVNTAAISQIRNAKTERYIALVEGRTFMRECMHRGMEGALSLPLIAFSTLSELESKLSKSVALVFLSLPDGEPAKCENALKVLADLEPSIPVVVFSTANDSALAKTAISLGAKGYIPITSNFDIAVEAVRFILAGGTYFPMDVLPSGPTILPMTQASELSTVLTHREIRIVKAIQQGKTNKLIAYHLSITEGTVKVHMRNIMKKMRAKNRTDVAIKAGNLKG